MITTTDMLLYFRISSWLFSKVAVTEYKTSSSEDKLLDFPMVWLRGETQFWDDKELNVDFISGTSVLQESMSMWETLNPSHSLFLTKHDLPYQIWPLPWRTIGCRVYSTYTWTRLKVVIICSRKEGSNSAETKNLKRTRATPWRYPQLYTSFIWLLSYPPLELESVSLPLRWKKTQCSSLNKDQNTS